METYFGHADLIILKPVLIYIQGSFSKEPRIKDWSWKAGLILQGWFYTIVLR